MSCALEVVLGGSSNAQEDGRRGQGSAGLCSTSALLFTSDRGAWDPSLPAQEGLVLLGSEEAPSTSVNFQARKRICLVTFLSFRRPQEESGLNLPTVVQTLLIHSSACLTRTRGVGVRSSRRESRTLGGVQHGTPSSHAGSSPQPICLVASCTHPRLLQ